MWNTGRRWFARRILFEIAGVPDDVAQEALELAARKLPIRTQVITRHEYGSGAGG